MARTDSMLSICACRRSTLVARAGSRSDCWAGAMTLHAPIARAAARICFEGIGRILPLRTARSGLPTAAALQYFKDKTPRDEKYERRDLARRRACLLLYLLLAGA